MQLDILLIQLSSQIFDFTLGAFDMILKGKNPHSMKYIRNIKFVVFAWHHEHDEKKNRRYANII